MGKRYKSKLKRTVTVKVQRPLMSTGSMNEVMSYIVDGDDDEQVSNAYTSQMTDDQIEDLFGEYHKVYYLAWYQEGLPVRLYMPTREDEWV